VIKEIIECLDGVDPENLRNQLHEDFLFVDELVMETPVEYVEAMEGMWSRNIDLTVERKIVADERDCCGFSFVREIEGVKHVITNLYLLKKGKIWRHIINRMPANSIDEAVSFLQPSNPDGTKNTPQI
tara:strand:+ start:638 stop:1021 length:384 start_codon:yes stop_codon:yes gene_type:complete